MSPKSLVSICALLAGCSTTSSAPPAAATTPGPVALAATAPPAQAEPAPAPADPHAAHHGGGEMPVFTLATLAEGAALLPDLGAHKRKVTTASPEAQAFFDQGLALTYGFNHDEAARAFAKGAALDPTCAMCLWGAAYTLGPNYNVPMLPDRAAAAWDAITRAETAVATAGTPEEKALIGALKKRYKGPEWVDPASMQAFNEAYSAAMRDVAAQFPKDQDVQVLFAEAAMNVNPWKLWTADGKPAPGTEEIVKVLEGVLKKNPKHPGANHYYIHAVEASKQPGRATASADRLAKLMPGAGHIVHMPAHIYQRVGRYSDASAANEAAVKTDQQYLATTKPPGYYPFYLGHNYGFLAYSASMQGRSADALAAAKESVTHIPKDIVCGMPGMDFFLSLPYLVAVRFGRFDDALAAPAPDAKYTVQTAIWHHARGMAFAAKGQLPQAREEKAAIDKIAAATPAEMLAGLSPATQLLKLAAKAVEARIAEAEKSASAIALWQEAVALEDSLAYSEPADWFYPTRHYLGAAMLDAGDAKGAEAVYRADLEKNANNGWALFGVWKSLEGQGKKGPAAAAEKQFKKAWAAADFELKRSAF